MTPDTISDAVMTPSRRKLLALAAGGGLGLSLLAGTRAVAEDDKPMFMFVQLASSTVVDDAAKTIRLVNLSPQTLYFADRPDRIAGHLKLDKFMAEWTAAAGPDNFSCRSAERGAVGLRGGQGGQFGLDHRDHQPARRRGRHRLRLQGDP